MIIIKNLFRIILVLILFTIIAQSKESDKINKNEWVISLEQYFLPSLIKKQNLVAYSLDGIFIDSGIPEDLEEATKYFHEK